MSYADGSQGQPRPRATALQKVALTQRESSTRNVLKDMRLIAAPLVLATVCLGDSIKVSTGDFDGSKIAVTVTVAPKDKTIEWLTPAAGTLTGPVSDASGAIAGSYTPPADPGTGVKAAGEVFVCAKIAGSNPVVKDCAVLYLPLEGQRGGPIEHVIVGLEQAGASAAQSERKFFFDFLVSRPWFGSSKDGQLGPRFRTWGNIRLTSVPQQIQASVAEFAAAGIATKIGELKVNEVAQGAEFLAGVDLRLWAAKSSLLTFHQSERARTSVSFIASFGAITPIYPKDGVDVYAAPPQNSDALARLLARYGSLLPAASAFPSIDASGQLTGGTVRAIAFVPQDRERFFRQYWGGIRLKTHYLTAGGLAKARPSHSLDLTIGRNENLTGGRFKGAVGRMEAFYALPFSDRYIYLFGSAQLRLQRDSSAQDALILNRPSANVDLTLPTTRLLSVPANSRDTWKIAIGIDFIGALRSWIDAAKQPKQ